MAKYFYTDGLKSVPIQDSWDFVDAAKAGNVSGNDLYALVAASFNAVNKSARAVAYMPFALVDKAGKDYDVSSAWENKVGFMPNHKDLLRRIRQSLIMSNTAYLRMGKNQFKIPKKLHYVTAPSIGIITDPITGDLVKLERSVNGRVVQVFEPDDNELIRFWWLDEKTELLPSPDTEFKAISSAAGILRYADYFTENFYRRGGIKPTLIAMKGLVSADKKDELQKDWTSFVRGIGAYAKSISAKIFNAEAMDIKSFGDGLGDLKDTPVYRQALENISIGMDMPLSLLLSNSANRATADTEYVQWYRNSVVPWCDFLADSMNEQIFYAMNLRMEFRPEQNDPENQDERDSAQAYSTYVSSGMKPSVAAQIVGIELPQGMEYEDLDPEEVEETPEDEPTKEPEVEPAEEVEDVTEVPAAKWQPSLDELNELRIWRDVALRRFKKGESLAFDYQPHYGGLPEDVHKAIFAKLYLGAKTAEDVKAAFEVSQYEPAPIVTVTPEYKSEILTLASAINRLADVKLTDE